MPAVGNYVNRDERVSFADYNKAWAAKRREAIEKSQQLRVSFTSNVLNSNTQIYQRTPLAGAQGIYASTTAVMARVNILV
ncbi:MAG: flagellar biosynthesis protein [Roseibium sp.]|nr:flagellar biosynthesis protein [Roseibium sp.]